MGYLCGHVREGQEVVGHVWRTRHVGGTVQAQQEQVHNQPVVLDYEAGKLQTTDGSVRVVVVHVLGRGAMLRLGESNRK